MTPSYHRILTTLAAAAAGAAVAAAVQEHRVRAREYDSAYGMLNRAGVESRLARLRQAVDIVYLDLDFVHELNGQLGETEVDRLIRQAFQLRESDIVFCGRYYSGDEILIVVRAGCGAGLADRLLARLQSFGLSATIGVVGALDARGAIDCARSQVAESKRLNGRGRVYRAIS